MARGALIKIMVLYQHSTTDVNMSTSFKSTKRAPKTQTAAMWQMVKGMEEISKQQEKESDERLAMINMEMINMEMKRDEMLLAFQREQAEQNRQHELMLAQLLVQPGKNFANPVGPSSIGNLTPHGYDGSFAMVSGHHVDVAPSISGVGQNYPELKVTHLKFTINCELLYFVGVALTLFCCNLYLFY